MHPIAPLIKDLAVILSVAGLVTLLFQKIRQPVVLGYLVAGIIIGPFTPPYALVSDIPNIKTIAELGVIFLMFSLGLEFSFHKLMRVGFSASVTGIVEVALMMLLGFFTGRLIGWSFNDSIFLGAALSISSTTIIIKALEELNLQYKRFAELIFGVLIVEDLLAILLLVALSTVVTTAHFFSVSMAIAAAKLILSVGAWFLIGYFLVPPLLRHAMEYINSETLTIISVALCLLLVTVASYFHYSTALGAFVMGSILAETPEVTRIETLIRPIRDIFAAVFFVSVGMLIDPRIIIAHFPLVLLITAITIVGKIITSGVSAFLTGQSLNTSLRLGFSMAQIGEFSFIIAGLGILLGAINNTLYPIIVAVSVITTFTTPYLIRFSAIINDKLEKHISPSAQYFLNSYSTWFYRNRADTQHRATRKKAIFRFIINAIVIAIIFTLIKNLLVPELAKLIQSHVLIDVEAWIIALIISAPFIWAMLFAFKNNKNDGRLLYPPLIFAWIVTFAEISILSITYFETWFIIFGLTAVAIFCFIIFYNQLEKSYHWFEKRIIANIGNIEELQKKRFEQLAPWDSHLVKATISADSPMIGKTLQQASLREKFGINIVAIHRGTKTILSPRGQEQLLPEDQLIILGTDAQIEIFKKIIERPVPQKTDYSLENFTLKSLLIEKNHPFIGKSIRDSQIREKTRGIVLGLERQDMQILNPDPATQLEEGDLLIIVGEAELVDRLPANN